MFFYFIFDFISVSLYFLFLFFVDIVFLLLNNNKTLKKMKKTKQSFLIHYPTLKKLKNILCQRMPRKTLWNRQPLILFGDHSQGQLFLNENPDYSE